MRLPSLNALRALEAAARLGSLTAAGRELHVTPSAVRHQIRALEDELGWPLLRKSGAGVAPTEAALDGLPHLRRAFDALSEANRRLREPCLPSMLTISSASSLVSSWLIPRLDDFRVRHPGVTVRIDNQWGLTDFARDGVDLAIRYGLGGYPGLFEKRLFDEAYFPVCAPQLLEGAMPLRTPEDLAHFTLLHVTVPGRTLHWPNWQDWLMAAGVADLVDPDSGLHFSISLFAQQAAMASQGVALDSAVLAHDALASGVLVKPFDLEVPSPYGYFIVCPPVNRERTVVAAFIAWLEEMAAVTVGENKQMLPTP